MQFLEYKARYDSEHTPVMIAAPPAPSKTLCPTKTNPVVGPDEFMDQFIKNWETTLVTSVSATQVINPLEESDQYFSQLCVDQSVCTDLIAWWGVSWFFILCLPFLFVHRTNLWNTL